MQTYPRHQTGRAYARVLEVIGYVVLILGTISAIVTMYQLSFAAGIGYLLGAVVTGIALIVLGEVVIVLFNIEFNTSVMREAAIHAYPPSASVTSPIGTRERPSPALGGDVTERPSDSTYQRGDHG